MKFKKWIILPISILPISIATTVVSCGSNSENKSFKELAIDSFKNFAPNWKSKDSAKEINNIFSDLSKKTNEIKTIQQSLSFEKHNDHDNYFNTTNGKKLYDNVQKAMLDSIFLYAKINYFLLLSQYIGEHYKIGTDKDVAQKYTDFLINTIYMSPETTEHLNPTTVVRVFITSGVAFAQGINNQDDIFGRSLIKWNPLELKKSKVYITPNKTAISEEGYGAKATLDLNVSLKWNKKDIAFYLGFEYIPKYTKNPDKSDHYDWTGYEYKYK